VRVEIEVSLGLHARFEVYGQIYPVVSPDGPTRSKHLTNMAEWPKRLPVDETGPEYLKPAPVEFMGCVSGNLQ
jgi:hypothetical protein